eukprot:930504_1
MSGLTVGLMSIDVLKMRLLSMEGSDEDRRNVEKVSPLLKNHHLLLVTLLLANAAAMEALPIFLDRIVPAWAAILLAVTFVLIFGEILPQALCTSNPLKIGARMACLVRCCMVALYPIAKPIAMLLDKVIGHDDSSHVLFKRRELRALLQLQFQTGRKRRETVLNMLQQREGSNPADKASEGISYDELTMMHGALGLTGKCAEEVMTPLKKTFMLEAREKLTHTTMARILGAGHSRVPVYERVRHNIIGVVIVKRLIILDPDDGREVRDFATRKPIAVLPSTPLDHLLNEFQHGRSHMALVARDTEAVRRWGTSHDSGKKLPTILGVVTLEDVIEELIQEEIVDETDIEELRNSLSQRKMRQQKLRRSGVARAELRMIAILHRIREGRTNGQSNEEKSDIDQTTGLLSGSPKNRPKFSSTSSRFSPFKATQSDPPDIELQPDGSSNVAYGALNSDEDLV